MHANAASPSFPQHHRGITPSLHFPSWPRFWVLSSWALILHETGERGNFGVWWCTKDLKQMTWGVGRAGTSTEGWREEQRQTSFDPCFTVKPSLPSYSPRVPLRRSTFTSLCPGSSPVKHVQKHWPAQERFWEENTTKCVYLGCPPINTGAHRTEAELPSHLQSHSAFPCSTAALQLRSNSLPSGARKHTRGRAFTLR